ncbi:glycosyltransferase family 8 protein [Lapidilactobacillus achengensis]|uniref:Glycosyltransferase family 8 protein n=1 Tax=Lapidilactobacillus achengensis TaxID=2486000 RepID=A0ABW1UQZ6_9LACO|nr:glycosyltransferase family 8 protein [Lapidilactobacillus achengensis]
MAQRIEILVTLNEAYLPPLQVMLVSLFENNPHQSFRIWLIHRQIPAEKLTALAQLVHSLGGQLKPIQVDGQHWTGAPTEARYPIEMYFRLLCADILPKTVKRVLYLDPDILVVNPVQQLWQTELDGKMLAAATHSGMTHLVTGINNIRLGTDHGYYNSGVMLIDLAQARKIIKYADIERIINEHSDLLLLPDQDILNFLYGEEIKEIPEENWNYDARKYPLYFTRSLGKHDLQWTLVNTAVLHFCGHPKPWEAHHDNRFTALYLNYQQLTARRLQALAPASEEPPAESTATSDSR